MKIEKLCLIVIMYLITYRYIIDWLYIIDYKRINIEYSYISTCKKK